MFLNFPQMLPNLNSAEDSIVKQDVKNEAACAQTLGNPEWINPTTSISQTKYELDRVKICGYHDCASKNSCYEEISYGSASSFIHDGLSSPLKTGQPIIQEIPPQSDDKLYLTGDTLALAYIEDRENPKVRNSLAAWICKLSLAGDEHSVSFIIHSKCLANS